MSIENVYLSLLLQLLSVNALINSPACYQSHIPTYIDHIFINQKSLYTFSKTFKTSFNNNEIRCLKGPPKKKRFTDVIKSLKLQIFATL